MVYQISGIMKRINRESTSGRTIRKLPLTKRSSLGILDNPRNTVSEMLRIIQFAKQNENRTAERGFGVSECSVRLWRKRRELGKDAHIHD